MGTIKTTPTEKGLIMAKFLCTSNENNGCMFTTGRVYDAIPAGHNNQFWTLTDDKGHDRFLGSEMRFITGRTPHDRSYLTGDWPLYAYFEQVTE
jgi:hypothetical protein